VFDPLCLLSDLGLKPFYFLVQGSLDRFHLSRVFLPKPPGILFVLLLYAVKTLNGFLKLSEDAALIVPAAQVTTPSLFTISAYS